MLDRELESIDAELARQSELVAQKNKEAAAITAKYDADKQRWRELSATKATKPATPVTGATATAVPAKSATPATGGTTTAIPAKSTTAANGDGTPVVPGREPPRSSRGYRRNVGRPSGRPFLLAAPLCLPPFLNFPHRRSRTGRRGLR